MSRRDYDRFGIGALMREGFEVMVVDLTAVLQPKMLIGHVSHALDVQILTPESITHGARVIAGLVDPATVFVCLLGYSLQALPVFRALGSKARYVLLATNALPYGNIAPRASMVLRRSLRLARVDWAESIFFRLPSALFGVGTAEVVIAGGERSLTPFETRLAGPDTLVLWAHALDYDLFLAAEGSGEPVGTAHVVFLDQFLEGHPDQWQQAEPFCDPTTYYSNLQRAFDDVEESLGTPVIIAAHPRSDYEARDPRFGGRAVVFGRTLDLVRGSRLVLGHDSTSIGMAVHFRRPVCFITDDGVQRSDVRRLSAQVMAEWLGCSVHNLDGPALPKWSEELEFDADCYGGYRRAFLKADASPDRPSWKIFSEYLRGTAEVEPLRRFRSRQ